MVALLGRVNDPARETPALDGFGKLWRLLEAIRAEEEVELLCLLPQGFASLLIDVTAGLFFLVSLFFASFLSTESSLVSFFCIC